MRGRFELNVEYPVGCGRLLRLEQGNGDVVDGNASRGASVQFAVMSVAMNHKIGAMPVDHFCQSRSAKKRRDLWCLAFNGGRYRRIVEHHYTFPSAQLRHCAFQLQSFVDRSPDKSFDFRLAKRG